MLDIKPSPDYLSRSSGGGSSFSNFSMLFAGNWNYFHILFFWLFFFFFRYIRGSLIWYLPIFFKYYLFDVHLFSIKYFAKTTKSKFRTLGIANLCFTIEFSSRFCSIFIAFLFQYFLHCDLCIPWFTYLFSEPSPFSFKLGWGISSPQTPTTTASNTNLSHHSPASNSGSSDTTAILQTTNQKLTTDSCEPANSCKDQWYIFVVFVVVVYCLVLMLMLSC